MGGFHDGMSVRAFGRKGGRGAIIGHTAAFGLRNDEC